MSDYPDLRIRRETFPPWPDAATEGIGWGSDAARETIRRICREAALRCQQTIAVHGLRSVPDGDEHTRSE